MKRILISLFLLWCTLQAFSQYTYFNNLYNNYTWSAALNILETDTGYLACGVSGEISGEYIFKRIVLMALDNEGHPGWWKTYGEDFHNYYSGSSRSLIKTSDGGYALGGTIEDSIRAVGLLLKLDENGEFGWHKTRGDTLTPSYSPTTFTICTQLPDNGYLMTGTNYISDTDGDVILIRTDSIGNEIWSQTYGIPNWGEKGFTIALLPDGAFLIGINKQYLGTNNTSRDPGLLKVDSLGNQIWMKYYGGPYNDGAAHVQLLEDGNYIFGSTYAVAEPTTGYPLHKAWVVTTDTSGNIIREKKYGGVRFFGWCSTMDILDDGSLLLSGTGSFEDSMGPKGWVLKTKFNGDSLWFRRYFYFPNELNHLLDLQVTSDTGIIIAGTALAAGEPQAIWIQKLDSIGCDTAGCDPTVGIYAEPAMQSDKNEVMCLFPNPANSVLNLAFQVESHRSKCYVEVWDLFGRRVEQIHVPKGQKMLRLDVSAYPAGVYITILKNAKEILERKKFVVSR